MTYAIQSDHMFFMNTYQWTCKYSLYPYQQYWSVRSTAITPDNAGALLMMQFGISISKFEINDILKMCM